MRLSGDTRGCQARKSIRRPTRTRVVCIGYTRARHWAPNVATPACWSPRRCRGCCSTACADAIANPRWAPSRSSPRRSPAHRGCLRGRRRPRRTPPGPTLNHLKARGRHARCDGLTFSREGRALAAFASPAASPATRARPCPASPRRIRPGSQLRLHRGHRAALLDPRCEDLQRARRRAELRADLEHDVPRRDREPQPPEHPRPLSAGERSPHPAPRHVVVRRRHNPGSVRGRGVHRRGRGMGSAAELPAFRSPACRLGSCSPRSRGACSSSRTVC